ncbi:LacI family DNA-binding transcriptional regulator [Rhizobium viscosum]|uniref:LacI family DNA-binding transcriptional regulator n=1 Tax=Rhizobium viscosum TaxID=1673 RepID=UPI00178A478D|nr:LacI family DNA-binding transcriptional regulator [Rhizobium viscosum]
MRKSTLEEVAAAAGVSKMTASRALRGAPDVSPETRQRVLNATEQLGYVGNRLALSLSSRKTNLVAVVVPSMSNIVFPEVLAGISAGLEGSGMQAVFGLSDYDAGKERDVIRDMLSWRPSAIIVTGLDQPEDTVKMLRSADIPVIQIMDLDGTPIDFNVGLSHGKAGEEMARALIAAGRRRFGYIGSALERDLRAAKRRAGFERVLHENRLAFIGQRLGDTLSSVGLGKHLTHELLRAEPNLDCIYYSNDDMAVGGAFASVEAFRSDDILMAGFNGLELAAALPVRIATSRSPRRLIGEVAARLACDPIASNASSSSKITAFVPEITGVV